MRVSMTVAVAVFLLFEGLSVFIHAFDAESLRAQLELQLIFLGSLRVHDLNAQGLDFEGLALAHGGDRLESLHSLTGAVQVAAEGDLALADLPQVELGQLDIRAALYHRLRQLLDVDVVGCGLHQNINAVADKRLALDDD